MKAANVKTEVKFVMDLLTELRNGRLRVPKFQRPFVWNQDKMRRLLDSIVRGYPIGSIFVWETSERYENLVNVGPVQVKVDQPEEPAAVGYLLDGHQRLSTLLGTLSASEEEVDRQGGLFKAYYNLETEEFEHTRRVEIHHFPLWKLMDTSEFLGHCEKLRTGAPEQAARWLTRAKVLVDVLRNCKVGQTTVSHRDMSEAIEAFTRLNTEGVRMTPEQIFFALSYREGEINVGAEIDQITEAVLAPLNYGDVSRTALLRVLLASMNKDIYGSAVDWRKLVRDEPELLKTALGACRESLEASVKELHALGATSHLVLPYALQLVLFCEFFRAAKGTPTQDQLKTLRRWFWVSAFSGAFMVGSSKRFNDAVDAARKLARGEVLDEAVDLTAPALPLPRAFHQRAARVRAFFLFLKSLKPLDPMTLKPAENVLDTGFQGARQMFRQLEGKLSRDLANRLLLGPAFPGDLVSAFEALRARSEAERTPVLESHGIPEAAWLALLERDAQGFISTRRAHLMQLELNFMKEQGVAVPREGAIPEDDAVEDLPDDSET